MPDGTPSQCTPITSAIGELEAERADLQGELREAPPSVKPILLREIRRVNLELARKRQELRVCLQQNPPAPRPDLVAQNVLINVNHAAREVSVAALIKNIGTGNASGPFQIALAATLCKGAPSCTGAASVQSFVRVFEVPAGITIFGQPVLQQLNPAAVPGGITPSHEYVTERMTVPLCYRDDNPSCIYEFDFIVDAEQVVGETNEANNHFFARWWTTSPAAAQRETPFVIGAEEPA